MQLAAASCSRLSYSVRVTPLLQRTRQTCGKWESRTCEKNEPRELREVRELAVLGINVHSVLGDARKRLRERKN